MGLHGILDCRKGCDGAAMSVGFLMHAASWRIAASIAAKVQLVCLGALALTFAVRGGVNDVFSWQLYLVLQFPASLVLVGIFLGALTLSPPSRFDPFWIALAWVLPALLQWALLTCWFRKPWRRSPVAVA
jgi:hypothetical protein